MHWKGVLEMIKKYIRGIVVAALLATSSLALVACDQATPTKVEDSQKDKAGGP